MGAWGYKPFENDCALDWLDGVQRSVARAIYDGLTRMDNTHEALAAAQLLLDCTSASAQINIEYEAMNWHTRRPRVHKRGQIRPSKSLFDIALAVLEKLWNSDWPDEWNEPASCRKVIGSVRRLLCHRKRNLERKESARAKRIRSVVVRTASGRRKRKAA